MLASSNADAAVNFSSGTKDVLLRPAGERRVADGAARRGYQGDWSGALGTRTRLETLTTNSNTTVHVTPNGAGSTGAIALNNASDEANAAAALVGCNGTEAYFQCTSWGTGSTLPIKVKIDGATRLEIETNGTLNVAGTTTYEALVTHDDDIPNKKYVDDAISAYEVVTDLTPQLGGDLDTNNNKILFGDTSAYAVETELTPAIQLNGSIGTPRPLASITGRQCWRTSFRAGVRPFEKQHHWNPPGRHQ